MCHESNEKLAYAENEEEVEMNNSERTNEWTLLWESTNKFCVGKIGHDEGGGPMRLWHKRIMQLKIFHWVLYFTGKLRFSLYFFTSWSVFLFQFLI